MQDSRGDSVKELLTSAPKAVRMTPLSAGGAKRGESDYPACSRAGDRYAAVDRERRHSIQPYGGLVLTGKAVDLKSTGPQGSWGFESLALRYS
jgi:hypothetical protein